MQHSIVWALTLTLVPVLTVAQPWSVPSSLYSSYYQEVTGPDRSYRPRIDRSESELGTFALRHEGPTATASQSSVLGWRPSSYYGAEIAFQPLTQPVFVPFGAIGPLHRISEALIPLTVNAYAPFVARTEFTGRVGYLLNSSQRGDGYCFDLSGRAYNCRDMPFTVGVGLRYEVRDKLGVRMNYDLLDVKDAGIGLRSRSSIFSLGADYRY